MDTEFAFLFDCKMLFHSDPYQAVFWVASDTQTPRVEMNTRTRPVGGEWGEWNHEGEVQLNMSPGVNYAGQQVYTCEWRTGSGPIVECSGKVYDGQQPDGNSLWTIVFGTVTGGTQTVPVHWTPPASKFPVQKTRAASYEIEVSEAVEAAGGGGGGHAF